MANNKDKKGSFDIVGKIKHFILDPIKTPKEADARIKELLPYLGVSFGAALLFIILGIAIEAISGVFNVLGYICMLPVFLFGFCMFRAFQLKKKLGDMQCKKCGTIITYGDNVQYHTTRCNFNTTVNKTENKKAGMDLKVRGYEHNTVQFECTCQQCGTQKSFSKSFTPVDVEITKTGVSALNADLLLSQMKSDMEIAWKNNFEGASSDYRFKVRKPLDKLVTEFWNDDGTASKIGNTTVSASKK